MPSDTAPVIDTHNHYWRVGTDDLYWLEDPSDPVLGRDYLPPDLKPHMDAVGVAQSVIVQASHAWKDQLAYLEMAETYDYVTGVIAWVDLEAPDVGDRIDELATSPWFRAFGPGPRIRPTRPGWQETTFAGEFRRWRVGGTWWSCW